MFSNTLGPWDDNLWVNFKNNHSKNYSSKAENTHTPRMGGGVLGRTEGKGRSGQQRMIWVDSITDSMDVNFSKLWEIVEDRRAWHIVIHGVKKSQTGLSN